MTSLNKNYHDTSTSSLDPKELTSEDKHVQNFAKQMLQGRLFMGVFHEKRYVEILDSYRDVISISKGEKDLIDDLKVVKKRVEDYFLKDHWVGITTPDMIGAPATHCVWVELPQDHVLGCYWFKIRSVKFKEREMLLRLKVLKQVNVMNDSFDGQSTNCRDDNVPFNFNINAKTIRDTSLSYFVYFFTNICTGNNIKESVKLLAALLVAALTGSVQLLQFMCNFLLMFMSETSNIIKSLSPIVIAGINVFGKTVGGLYILIAMLWRDRKGPTPLYEPNHRRSYNSISYIRNPCISNQRRSLPVKRRSGVVITEVE